MPGKQIHSNPKIINSRLTPALLNRRRMIMKKILNRYMGLPFTQLQPPLSRKELREAGLQEIFDQELQQLFPENSRRRFAAEPIAIEVRGVAVALDEEISFSYYRYQTLQSPLYSLPLVQDIERYQHYCLSWAEVIGEAESDEISRLLRHKALNDFMQDMLPVVHHMPLLRLSVYDMFGDDLKSRSLHQILAEEDEPFYLHIADYITAELEKIDEAFYNAF